MTHRLVPPAKVHAGDRVAVVSPSFAAPAKFPHKHELAMQRLRDDLDLVPVEYPTTRQLDAVPADRARDLMAAFADPSVRAVLSTTGGDDQLTVLPHLDPQVFLADPKPFLGFSDNTNLLNWLWTHGIASYHGGSTMMHLGRGPELHPISLGSLRRALFDHGATMVHEVEWFSEDDLDWSDPANLQRSAPGQPGGQWHWHQPDALQEGRTWGGNLEILHWNLAVGRWMLPVDAYGGCVLILETSEEMPSAVEVFRMLRNMGERGMLEQFPAVLVGRPKASSHQQHVAAEERERYRSDQREAFLAAFAAYAPDAMLVFDVDLGHTDPQWVLPYGGLVTVDGPNRRVVAHY